MHKTHNINEVETVLLREQDAMRRYSLGRSLLRQVGKEAGAMIKIGSKCLRYKQSALDDYLLSGQAK